MKVENIEALEKKGEKKPFFKQASVCPICKTKSEHYYLRDRTYTIGKREDDYFISEYTWVEPEYGRYSLHSFGLWHCTNCKYTDERKMFFQKEIQQGRAQLDYLKKELLSKKENGDPFIEKICQFIDYPTHDILTVLNLSLLATYIHSLPEKIHQNGDKIAKHYLRTVWLFRVASQKPNIEDIKEFLSSYSSIFERLQSNVMNLLASVEELNQCVVDQNKKNNVHRHWLGIWERHNNELNTNYKIMCTSIDSVITTMRTYDKISNELKAEALEADKDILNLPYREFENYQSFLEGLKMFWPDIPMSEKEAIEKAALYFQNALKSKTYEFDSLKKFKILELIIALTEKSKSYSSALEFCEQLAKLTTNFQKNIAQRLKKQSVIKDETVDPEHMKLLIRRAQDILRRLSIKQDRIKSLKVRHDEVRAQQVFGSHRDLDIELLEEKLNEAQIDQAVIQHIVEEKKTSKKKGIFDLFKL